MFFGSTKSRVIYLVVKRYREHCMKAKAKVNRGLIGKKKVLKIHL